MLSRARPRALILAPLVVLVLLLAAACTKPETPLPPIAGPGEAVTGVNPEVPPIPNERVSVVSYGPYTVPGATGSGHSGAGMLENNVAFAIRRPCGDCYITGFTPQLKYPDGRVANIESGAWLHHFALYAMGRTDPSCAVSYPYNLLGERIFAGGNERTRARFPAGSGVRVGALDTWILIYDLMNTTPAPMPLVVEMTYHWVPASTPDMHAARALYLDVSPVCLESRMPAGPGAAFTHERRYPAPLPGRIVGVAGHLHDGGVRVTMRNDTTGQLICDSVGGYGGPGYEAPAEHGPPGENVAYLSSVGQCISPSIDRPLGVLRAGDQLHIQMFYDFGAHPAHAHVEDGVMGHFFGYILEER